ncbi:hypothetical protein RGQ29_002794 [Quercus rubra]|uniref:Uncharacterized protein n=1 Tax=Quercus rubra TaxID=3512 RepID=A0AAN7EA32_QUERU|nr:hypothetical protein RGQ29_002794 [Quercus rubra]
MEESASMEIQPATALINNEDQNTQKEANIPGGNESKNNELVIEIRKMTERPEIQSSKQCCIYKVQHQLRNWNEKAYTPQEYKERFFRSFVKRSNIKLEHLVRIIREMEENIRGCYAETIDLDSDRFVKMILVDACFILELLEMNHLIVEPRAVAVMFDLLLLENQLPFFVIEKLHQLAFPSPSSFSNYDALLKLSIKYIRPSYDFQFRDDLPDVEIYHFTDLLRTVQLPPPKNQPERRCVCQHICLMSKVLGVLKIPALELNDWTEVLIRNIMALEQTCYIEYAYFTDYFLLMDSLIDTTKDVDLLCDKKNLVNCLGDNDAAKSMINDLNKGIISVTKRDDYVDLCNKLNRLLHQYFSTPWRAASTVAAIILLVLTFIQTVCSIIQVT